MPKRKKENTRNKKTIISSFSLPRFGHPNVIVPSDFSEIKFPVNVNDYDYNAKHFENTLEILQEENYAEVIKSTDELRKHVKDIDTSKNDENHVIGSQGQIMVNFGAQKYFLGSGFMVSFSNGDQTHRSTHIETKQFVMTSTQLFKRIDSSRNQHLIAQSANFSLGLNIDADGTFRIDCQTALNEYYDDPEYYSNQFTFNPFHDIALAVCDIKNEIVKTKNIKMADVSIAKPGDRICIAGYPAEYNGKLYYMEGSIRGIYYNDREDSAIITYNDINVSHGMNGSPVYLKMDNESWVVIGVHVAYDKKNNVNIATALTKSKIDRLNAIANSYFHKPSQNLIYSPRVRKVGREASVVQVPMNILTNNKNPKYRLRGCQGQLITNFQNGARLLGSGLFLNVSFDNANGKKNQESEIWFVLTCAHLFLYHKFRHVQCPQIARFSDPKALDCDSEEVDADAVYLKDYYVCPDYLKDRDADLAIAVCKTKLECDKWDIESVTFEPVYYAKQGDPIRILNYPQKPGKSLSYVEGTISYIEYTNNDNAIIYYNDIDHQSLRNGLPVFFKKHDGSWAIIGVQSWLNRSGRSFTCAVGLTKPNLAWLSTIIAQYCF